MAGKIENWQETLDSINFSGTVEDVINAYMEFDLAFVINDGKICGVVRED